MLNDSDIAHKKVNINSYKKNHTLFYVESTDIDIVH